MAFVRLGSGLLFGPLLGLGNGLLFGLVFWALLGLFQGVSSETIRDHHRVVPNQGIRRSACNSLVLGLISTGIAWLSYGLIVWLGNGLSRGLLLGLIGGLSYGLSVGLLAGLLNGGLASFRHYVLRFLLWRAGAVPWRYVPFLDYAAECILLRKVGGGYIFIHRLLLEYFASLDNTSPRDEASAQTRQAQPVS
jgi:hypothetical protein